MTLNLFMDTTSLPFFVEMCVLGGFQNVKSVAVDVPLNDIVTKPRRSAGRMASTSALSPGNSCSGYRSIWWAWWVNSIEISSEGRPTLHKIWLLEAAAYYGSGIQAQPLLSYRPVDPAEVQVEMQIPFQQVTEL